MVRAKMQQEAEPKPILVPMRLGARGFARICILKEDARSLISSTWQKPTASIKCVKPSTPANFTVPSRTSIFRVSNSKIVPLTDEVEFGLRTTNSVFPPSGALTSERTLPVWRFNSTLSLSWFRDSSIKVNRVKGRTVKSESPIAITAVLLNPVEMVVSPAKDWPRLAVSHAASLLFTFDDAMLCL